VQAASDGEGKGATFTVSLPLVQSEDPIEREVAESRLAMLSAVVNKCQAELSGVKVLVVDDEPDSLALTKRVLDDCRAHVLTANTARDAIELLKTQRPSVLVSDIGMPDEDGYAMIGRIRTLSAEQGGNTPAVALTAYASAEDRARSINAGYQRHTAKPIEPAELIAIVADLAGTHS
jgi:CheY-like chemotaxis protein